MTEAKEDPTETTAETTAATEPENTEETTEATETTETTGEATEPTESNNEATEPTETEKATEPTETEPSETKTVETEPSKTDIELKERKIKVEGADIYVSGLLPADVRVTAESVEVKVSGAKVIAAYDIKVFDKEGNEWQPAEPLKIEVASDECNSVTKNETEVIYVPDELAESEEKLLLPVSSSTSSHPLQKTISLMAMNTHLLLIYLSTRQPILRLVTSRSR